MKKYVVGTPFPLHYLVFYSFLLFSSLFSVAYSFLLFPSLFSVALTILFFCPSLSFLPELSHSVSRPEVIGSDRTWV